MYKAISIEDVLIKTGRRENYKLKGTLICGVYDVEFLKATFETENDAIERLKILSAENPAMMMSTYPAHPMGKTDYDIIEI